MAKFNSNYYKNFNLTAVQPLNDDSSNAKNVLSRRSETYLRATQTSTMKFLYENS